jgi:hypothetical protein
VFLVLVLIASIPLSRRIGGEPQAGIWLEVRCSDRPAQRLDARRDQDVVLTGPIGGTTLRVQNGRAWIATAPCRNQLCRRMGRLDRPGRSLVCLPNRILVRFEGVSIDVDAVSH